MTSKPSKRRASKKSEQKKEVFEEENIPLLLEQLRNKGKKLFCNCEDCLMEELRYLVYQFARDLNTHYSKEWDKNKKAPYKCIRTLMEIHKRMQNLYLSIFSSKCKIKIYNEPDAIRIEDEILTSNDKVLLMTQLDKMFEEGRCKCLTCFVTKAPPLAYDLARSLHRSYPKSWDEQERSAILSKWMVNFFVFCYKHDSVTDSIKCRARRSKISTSDRDFQSDMVLTVEEEEQLLVKVQIEKNRRNCKCKRCSMNEVSYKVYDIAYRAEKLYPRCWDTNEQADLEWMTKFEERHARKISEVFLRESNCKNILPYNPTVTCLTLHDERWLLTQINLSKTRFACDCKSCIMKEVALRAYELVREYQKPYPLIWDETRQADSGWLERFKIRHTYHIQKYKFPLQCKAIEPLYQPSTSELSTSVTVFTLEEEEWLLSMLYNSRKRTSECNCQSCIMENMPSMIYSYASLFKRSHPRSWSYNGKSDPEWMEKFKVRHSEKIIQMDNEYKTS